VGQKALGGEPCRGTLDEAKRGSLHSWNPLAHGGRDDEDAIPKRRRHMVRFAFLEVGFIGGVVWVSFAFDLYVSLNGRATGEQQVHFTWFAVVVACFPEESPVIVSLPLKIFPFEPAGRFLLVPSSAPLPCPQILSANPSGAPV
jgi:hypothetical protein